MSRSQDPTLTLEERLRILYPMVDDQRELPKYWSSQDKFNYIGLSQNHLRVQYKGHGKTHKDASSVRAEKPIPASAGIYYFEVKIVSKGRDGYMGVGLSAQGVSMNRLPGWDKHSYGYHGDDGHSFCSSGTGQAYGPTFTTGDVIGCGLNLVDGSCFYTKNGHNLGVAFTDLPPKLYPTVGLQTPGEVVDANFGQEPFLFDIEGEMIAQRAKVVKQIEEFPTPGRHGDWQNLLHQMVSTFLVHHGFSSTAEAFQRVTGQPIEEDFASIKNRQNVQNLVLSGKMSEAIKVTEKLFPMLLEENPSLRFMLKVRQFIEMVAGCDSVDNIDASELECGSIDQSSPNECEGELDLHVANGSSKQSQDQQQQPGTSASAAMMEQETNGNSVQTPNDNTPPTEEEEDTMEVDQTNGAAPSSSNNNNNASTLSNPSRLDKLIKFGQNLQQMLQEMEQGRFKNEVNSKMLQDAFSLLCYTDPVRSPVGWQLDQQEREAVNAALNTAILESKQLPGHPPLEVSLVHSKQLLRLMAENGFGTCAFANVDDFLRC